MKNRQKLKLFSVLAILALAMAWPLPRAQAAQHPKNTLVVNNGTVYYLDSSNTLRPFESAEIFKSYGFSFAKVQQASAEDTALPVGQPVPFKAGSLVNDDGTIYLITGGTDKRGFGSYQAFKDMGYKISDVVTGDLKGYSDKGVINTGDAHPAQTLVQINGTVYLTSCEYNSNTEVLRPIASPEILKSWGFDFGDILPGNAIDQQLTKGSMLAQRASGVLNPAACDGGSTDDNGEPRDNNGSDSNSEDNGNINNPVSAVQITEQVLNASVSGTSGNYVSTVGAKTGDSLQFKITVTNNGSAAVSGLSVQHTANTGFTFATNNPDNANGWMTVATLAPGQSATFVLNATVSATSGQLNDLVVLRGLATSMSASAVVQISNITSSSLLLSTDVNTPGNQVLAPGNGNTPVLKFDIAAAAQSSAIVSSISVAHPSGCTTDDNTVNLLTYNTDGTLNTAYTASTNSPSGYDKFDNLAIQINQSSQVTLGLRARIGSNAKIGDSCSWKINASDIVPSSLSVGVTGSATGNPISIAANGTSNYSDDYQRVVDTASLSQALKNYNTAYGGFPSNLSALVPTYINAVPTAPIASGACTADQNTYTYTGTGIAGTSVVSGTSVYPQYTISFCLGGLTNGTPAGVHTITPYGMQ